MYSRVNALALCTWLRNEEVCRTEVLPGAFGERLVSVDNEAYRRPPESRSQLAAPESPQKVEQREHLGVITVNLSNRGHIGSLSKFILMS